MYVEREEPDPNLDIIIREFEKIAIPQSSGVSFAGKGYKLNTKEDAKEVVEAIEICEDMQYVNFEGNSMGVEAAEEIGKVLSMHKELKEAIWKDMFTGRLKTEIPQALKHLGKGVINSRAQLEVLDLSDNASGPIGVEGFGPLLNSRSCFMLRELRLNNMGLGVTGARMLADALLQCRLASEKHWAGPPFDLVVFSAGRNRLEDEGAIALATVFTVMDSLQEISIPQNGIRARGFVSLMKAIRKHALLSVLNINDNLVGSEEGADAVAEAVSKLPYLITLDLGDCLLRNEGARKVCEAFKERPHKRIKEVNMSFNEIRSDVGLELATVLSERKTVQSVNLNGNQFGPEGKEAILSALADRGKSEILASLSEDEGESDEDEDGDNEEGEEEEDEDEEGESESDEDEDVEDEGEEEEEGEKEEEAGKGISPMLRAAVATASATTNGGMLPKQKVTVADFLKKPTMDNFMALEGDKGKAIVNEVKGSGEGLLSALDVVSELCAEKGPQGAEALAASEAIFRALFQGPPIPLMANINNVLPVVLGFIKDEETKKRRKQDTTGSRVAARNALSKRIFPPLTQAVMEQLLMMEEK